MALTVGARLGVYQITSAIGGGEMGEVYRAKDSRVKREVAIKVLRSSVAQDAERLVGSGSQSVITIVINWLPIP